jgi:hypothetical protein
MRLAVLALTLAACSPALRAQIKERRDVRTLGMAANEYWMAVRWNDPGRASQYLETAEERLRLGRIVSEPKVRITDVSVMSVVVGEELPDDRLPEMREGVALVRLESFDDRGGKVEVFTYEQHWVRDALGWKVDAEQSPLGSDRPW